MGDLSPVEFWALFSEVGLAKFGRIFCALPASTANLERVFSGASFVVDGRWKLSGEHHAQEVYLRHNGRLIG